MQNFLLRYVPLPVFETGSLAKETMSNLADSMLTIDLTGQLTNITCPTLLACGSKDWSNQAAALQLAEMIPNAVYYQLQDVGHEANIEAPEKVAAMLTYFYRQQ